VASSSSHQEELAPPSTLSPYSIPSRLTKFLVFANDEFTYCGEPVLYYFEHLFQESDGEFLDFVEYADALGMCLVTELMLEVLDDLFPGLMFYFILLLCFFISAIIYCFFLISHWFLLLLCSRHIIFIPLFVPGVSHTVFI